MNTASQAFDVLVRSTLLERLSGKTPLAQPRACITYAAGGSDRLVKRLAKEAAKP